MLNTRLDEISQKPDAPFLGAGASKGTFVGRTTEAFTLAAGVKDGGDRPRARGAARRGEARRPVRLPADRSSIAQKQSMLRGYERALRRARQDAVGGLVGGVRRTTILIGEAIPGHRVRVQARAAARADDHARRRQQAGEQLDHRRESRDHRAVAGEGQRQGADARRAARGVRARREERRSSRTRRICRAKRSWRAMPTPGKVVSGAIDSRGERHRVEAVERRARAGEADRLQGRRSVVQRVQPGRVVARVRMPTYMSAALASQIMARAASAQFSRGRSRRRS